MKNRKAHLLFVGICFLFISCAEETQKPPNILWINLDDLGVELGCYGNEDVQSPNIDGLAAEGTIFSKAYATAPICSPSRSSMITGMYPASINSIDHRPLTRYELPENVSPITEYFREAGYFCTNGSGRNMAKKGKSDFNFKHTNIFDGTDWSQRAPDQPFFAQVQIFEPHRPFVKDLTHPINPDSISVPEIYPNHRLIKADWAHYLESIQVGDSIVGQILDRLEREGLADNTIIFLFGDNGRPHLRDKQFLYEGGLHVPLIVKFPKGYGHQDLHSEELVSLIDVSATSLSLCGIPLPKGMHGQVFLGKNKGERKYVFGARQRSGDAIDDMRSITDGRFKLIWNRMPQIPWMQMSGYKKSEYPAYTLFQELFEAGEMDSLQARFMAVTKPELELYDLKTDPLETKNLAANLKHKDIQTNLFQTLKDSLAVYEKDWIPEAAETTQKAVQNSKKYFRSTMKRIGLSENASNKEIMEYWESNLLKQHP